MIARVGRKIVSLHGYCTSHDTGYERAVRDEFSKKHDFVALDLLGHASGRDLPRFTALTEVIEEAVDQLGQEIDEQTIIVGTSFGAYPMLEYLRRNPERQLAGAVFIKPMVDTSYTVPQPFERLKGLRQTIRPEEAIQAYTHGTVKKPFEVNVPALVLSGTDDQVAGDSAFHRERLRGKDSKYVVLDGPHNDSRPEDLRKAVEEIHSFMKRVQTKGYLLQPEAG